MAKYVCNVCGYTHEGDAAPSACPICRAPADKFTKQDGELTWAAEHVIGVAQGAREDIIMDLRANFEGECCEVGMYLAMARVAHREGYPEVGLYYEKAAWEEAEHAAKFAIYIESILIVSDTLQKVKLSIIIGTTENLHLFENITIAECRNCQFGQREQLLEFFAFDIPEFFAGGICQPRFTAIGTDDLHRFIILQCSYPELVRQNHFGFNHVFDIIIQKLRSLDRLTENKTLAFPVISTGVDLCRHFAFQLLHGQIRNRQHITGSASAHNQYTKKSGKITKHFHKQFSPCCFSVI